MTSGLDGSYLPEDLEPGKHVVVVSHVGHISEKREVLVKAGETTTVNFLMSSSALLDEIVVTGTMKPTFVSSSPVKIDVVTSEQFDLYLPSAASSIIESVQLVNGVQEVIDCGVCYTNSISVNGLPGSYTAILMDGTPIYGSLASVYGLNGIPNMIIDRFEVIKGPNSTLYGSDAVAGVINVITKNPSEQPMFSADVMTTTMEEVFANIAFAPELGKSNGYIGLNLNYVNNYQDINDDGFGDGVNTDVISLFSKFNIYRPSDKIFTIAAKYYYEDRRNGVEDFCERPGLQTIERKRRDLWREHLHEPGRAFRNLCPEHFREHEDRLLPFQSLAGQLLRIGSL